MDHYAAPKPEARELQAGIVWFFLQSALLAPVLQQFLPVSTAAGIFTLSLVNAAGCLIISRKAIFSECRQAAASRRKILAWTVLGLAVYYGCAGILSAVLYRLAPQYQNPNDAAILQTIAQSPALTWGSVCILAPIAEECLFRRLIFRNLSDKSKIVAHLLCACLFACAHVAGYIGSVPAHSILISLLQYLPAGLCLSLSYALSGNLITPILIHAVINSVSYLYVR